MSGINDVVKLAISRETTTVSKPGFGVPALIAKFAENYPTTPFTSRFRHYTRSEVADDWAVTDAVYKGANQIFSQNPSVSKIMVGRWDAGDISLTSALNAIQLDSTDWYAFSVVGQKEAFLDFSSELITGNTTTVTINGTTLTGVAFTTDHDATMEAIADLIEADITGAVATVESSLIISVVIPNKDVFAKAVVTGGASQTSILSYSMNDTVATLGASWAEANKKIFFTGSSAPEIIDGGVSDDLFSTLKGLSYDRTVMCFSELGEQYAECAFPGECLPFNPGSQTWAYKTLSGVSPSKLTGGQSTAVRSKNGNTYETIAGVNITRDGKVASGQFIDIIRGQDWLEAEIQAEVFTKIVNARKIPYDDSGIQLIQGGLASALDAGVNAGVIQDGYTISVPKFADISKTDVGNRNLPNVKFTAVLLGAIHTVEIQGTLTL